ncbi:MAG: DUF2959 family protein [Planctomycetes bacterium]|nr:DUF2959 family protein [Planctomycetota bacterium]
MVLHPFVLRTLAVVPLLSLVACNATYHQSQGLQVVDDLVSQVETVHVECELARQSVRTTVDAMVELLSPKGNPDRVKAFADFGTAIDQSVLQLQSWSKALEAMQSGGERFFAGWAKDLDAFTSTQMRLQSRARMEATRSLYEAILVSSQAPLEAHARFNAGMSDVRLFLGRDFNMQAFRAIESQLRDLIREAGALEKGQNECMQNARTYVEQSGLPPKPAVTVTEQAPAK